MLGFLVFMGTLHLHTVYPLTLTLPQLLNLLITENFLHFCIFN